MVYVNFNESLQFPTDIESYSNKALRVLDEYYGVKIVNIEYCISGNSGSIFTNGFYAFIEEKEESN